MNGSICLDEFGDVQGHMVIWVALIAGEEPLEFLAIGDHKGEVFVSVFYRCRPRRYDVDR